MLFKGALDSPCALPSEVQRNKDPCQVFRTGRRGPRTASKTTDDNTDCAFAKTHFLKLIPDCKKPAENVWVSGTLTRKQHVHLFLHATFLSQFRTLKGLYELTGCSSRVPSTSLVRSSEEQGLPLGVPHWLQRSKDTIMNNCRKPWLCICKTHFLKLIPDCKKPTENVWVSDSTCNAVS